MTQAANELLGAYGGSLACQLHRSAVLSPRASTESLRSL
jgi:hypothetical protein